MKAENFIFPSALSCLVKPLDEKTLSWAWAKGLFESHTLLDFYKKQRINWFASFLFPEMEEKRLTELTRFFLCLFLIDDYWDKISLKDAKTLVEGFTGIEPLGQNHLFQVLTRETLLLKSKICLSYQPDWAYHFEKLWQDYIEGLLWELKVKTSGHFPPIRDYQIMRPHSSGVFLALQFLVEKEFPSYWRKLRMEQDIARYICLANDCASAEKERFNRDPINELLIREQYLDAGLVRSQVGRELARLERGILDQGQKLKNESAMAFSWVEKIMLLVGGCLAWSYENLRYTHPINGEIRI